jgi:beta-lactamase class A
MKCLITIFFLFMLNAISAQVVHYKEDLKLSAALKKIVQDVKLDSSFNVGEDGKETISFAVINLNGRPRIGGVGMDNFIYPASVYKMYVAMEVLKQVSENKYALNRLHTVTAPNDVDRSKEIFSDPRPLLKAGDTVTVNYLLDLMITRSDNSAANCLIDIAGRKNINQTIKENGWSGSEVTRKFLKRAWEDPGYDTIRGTETCARHAADLMCRVENNSLVNPWVSMQLKALLSRQLDITKLSKGLPPDTMFSHKSGWWSYYTHDVGIVEDGTTKYVIALFTPVPEEEMNGRMQLLSEKVYELMKHWH